MCMQVCVSQHAFLRVRVRMHACTFEWVSLDVSYVWNLPAHAHVEAKHFARTIATSVSIAEHNSSRIYI